jgi:hypothetical protein
MSDPIDLGPEEHRMKITIPDFMHDWVSKNIHSQAYPTEGGIDAEPEALAMRCLAGDETDYRGAPTLSSLEISKSQSSRWQQLAAVPEAQFEAALAASARASTS